MRLSIFFASASSLALSVGAVAIAQGVNNNNINNNANNNVNNNLNNNDNTNTLDNSNNNVAPVITLRPTVTLSSTGGVILPIELIPTSSPADIIPTLLPTELLPTSLPTNVLPTLLPPIGFSSLPPVQVAPTEIVPTDVITDVNPTILPTQVESIVVPISSSAAPTATTQPDLIADACAASPEMVWNSIEPPSDNDQFGIGSDFSNQDCCVACFNAPGCTFWATTQPGGSCFLTVQQTATDLDVCPLGMQDITWTATEETGVNDFFWGVAQCGGNAILA